MKKLTIGIALLTLAVAVVGCTKYSGEAKKSGATGTTEDKTAAPAEHKTMKPVTPPVGTEPEGTTPETKKPDAVKPEAEPEAKKPDAVTPEAEPEAKKPDAVTPEAKPEAKKPDAATPEAKPEAKQPEIKSGGGTEAKTPASADSPNANK